MSNTLRLSNHTINRGDFILCQGIHLELQSGQICHLIGANGTGKTTFLMQLAGLLPLPNTIENIKTDNFETETPLMDKKELEEKTTTHSYKHNILPTRPVYISHQLGIHEDLTVEQNLRFLLSLYGMNTSNEDIDKAIAWVELEGYEDTTCRQLSAGQARRVNLARLKLMTPEHSPLWLLDEPFTALDVHMVKKLQMQLRTFTNHGGAILMTSHQIENMTELFDFTFNLEQFVT